LKYDVDDQEDGASSHGIRRLRTTPRMVLENLRGGKLFRWISTA